MLTEFETLAEQVVHRHEELMLGETPDKAVGRVLKALLRFDNIMPLSPVEGGLSLDLAGFGRARIHCATYEAPYLLLSEVADELGWPLLDAHAWAVRDHDQAVQEQRRVDEERGDGRLGYECLIETVDLQVRWVLEDPSADPGPDGDRVSIAGDWLIAATKVPSLLCSSPWRREFTANARSFAAHSLREAMGDRLQGRIYGPEGQPLDDILKILCSTDLTEEEAMLRARRGPALNASREEDE